MCYRQIAAMLLSICIIYLSAKSIRSESFAKSMWMRMHSGTMVRDYTKFLVDESLCKAFEKVLSVRMLYNNHSN